MKAELINVTVVPAQPGYKLFTAPEIDETFTYESIPIYWMHDIVAWRIDNFQRPDGSVYSLVEAVTAEGCHNGDYYILRPDGAIEQPYTDAFEDMATLIKHLREKPNGNA